MSYLKYICLASMYNMNAEPILECPIDVYLSYERRRATLK